MRQAQKKMFIYSTVLLAGVISFLSAFGQNDPPYTSMLQGDSIKAGKTITVQDTVFFNPLLKPSILRTNSVSNVISLRINEYSNLVLPDSFKIEVKIRLIYINKDNLRDSVTEKILTIDYNKFRSYKSRDIYYLGNAYQMQVKVLQVTPSYAPLNKILPALQLENKLQIDRDYVMNIVSGTQMNCAANAITQVNKDVSTIAEYGELKISWLPNRTVENYDVEWTYIDKSALDNGRYNANGQLSPALIFKNNASRITTTADTCMIPLLYDGEGSLFYRVRGVQQGPDGELITTVWSSEVSGPGLGRHDFTGHERKLNWQATTNFAEEAKRKSVVQYFDGSLRSRQTVTRDNTTRTTVAAETFYDKQGRPVIQVLPAPTLSKLIGYTPNLNVANINGSEYDKGIYDTLINAADYCDLGADSMSVANGTSRYYSPANPLKDDGFHQFIPDAKGYAFTETKYTQDNTGRINKQSGAGKNFQIGSGHETKYYYGTPEQTDLDALFGTEVGEASHYYKNMVRDANGQYSVSYVDMHGRTIATALAGDSARGMQRLSSYRDSIQTESLLNLTNNVITGTDIHSSKSLLVSMAGNHTFTYGLAAESLTLQDCLQRNICYDCLYDLTITITDDCNNQLLGGNPVIIKKSNFKLFEIDTLCNTATPLDTSFTRWLEPGSYNITKALSISKEGMQYYRDSLYMAHNACKTYEEILTEQKEIVRNDINCASTPESRYEYQSYRRDMLMDLYPLVGQYADTASDRQCYSIFNAIQNNYQRSDLAYKDEEGNPALVMNDAGAMVVPQQLTTEEFIQSFEKSWANALLPLHPEYTMLAKYESFSASHIWEEDFSKTETYAQAKAKGYLNPTGNTTQQPASSFSVITPDPLFNAYTESNSARSAIENSLFNFQNVAGVNISLWGFATAMGKCPDTNPIDQACVFQWNQAGNPFNEASLCEGELDMAWKIFRTQYLTKKNDWLTDYLKSVTGTNVSPPCVANFSKATDLLQQGGFNFTPQDSVAIKNSANAFYADNCRAFATRWWKQLQDGCTSYGNQDSATIISYLIEVCKEGSDINHPYGSSTVKPGSAYRFKSFEQVIKYYNDSTGRITDINCNSYLIDKPLPYAQSVLLVRRQLYGKPDTCECEKISTFNNLFTAQAAQYGTFSNFMLQKYDTKISQGTLDSLLNLCNNTINCKYIPKPVYLPTIFQCLVAEACVPCNRVKSLYDSFLVKFPGRLPLKEESDTIQQKINQVFVSYMNQQLGFSKSHLDYLNFIDSCRNFSSGSCDSLQDIVDYYLQNIKRGKVIHTLRTEEGQIFNDLSQIIDNGTIHFPDSIRQRPGSWYNNYSMNMAYGNRFCTNNGYTAEIRFKFLQNDLGGDVFYSSLGNNVGFTVQRYFGGANNGLTMNSSGQRYFLDADPNALLDWMTFKVKVLPAKTFIYYKNRLILEQNRDPNVPIGEQFSFGMGLRGRHVSIDWIKVSDGQESLKYFEDFNDAAKQGFVDPSFICPAPPNCQTTFTSYFNQRKGTNFTFNQIDSLYFADCGNRLDVCGDNDTLKIATSGVPKPAAITCDKLTTTYKNFLADFPDPSKGAIVGSLLQCEELFEWYFNDHLNTTGYTYANFTDWLVNGCGYKIKQLPCNDSVFVSCDTLQNIRTIFEQRYPVALGNTITETLKVPVHKVTHIMQRFLSNGTFIDETTFPSGASLSVQTWTNGGYWFNTRDNVGFDFRALPVNATINNAVLNLYAKPEQIEFFPCCGAHYRRTSETNVIGIIERLADWVIPGKTLWSTQPATIPTNGITLAPISIRNGAGSASDLFSNEDYLGQQSTQLVRDMHSEAWQNRNYGVLFKKNLENINVYKAYTFWGITHHTPVAKLPNLEVNFTANRCDLFTAFVNSQLGTHLTTAQVQQLFTDKCGTTVTPCGTTPPVVGPVNSNGPLLCGKTEALDEPFVLIEDDPCADSTNFAIITATERYRIYKDSLAGAFEEAYQQKCLNAINLESFSVTHPVSEYHYTLYYYDLAGNLVKTLPPQGVQPNRDPAWLQQVTQKRITGERLVPNHTLPTVYRYNSLNHVVTQQSPDGGYSEFWYDRLGRLVVSRNAKQKAVGKYSYTLYDALGRINEVGQKVQPAAMTNTIARNATALNSWLKAVYFNVNGSRCIAEQVKATVYDVADNAILLPMPIPVNQKSYTLRNRVSYTRTYDYLFTLLNAIPRYGEYDYSTTYSYDIHGNVDTLMQQYRTGLMAAHADNRFKVIAYKYDLVSGKVNQVHYQPGQPDQLFHRYDYDADNRITDVYISENKLLIGDINLEEHDAHYDYYKHGPVARTVLGQQQVQGLDYAYTLQGWMKGLNSTGLDDGWDMGNDGKIGSSHSIVAKDALGFNLNYFTGDYSSISTKNIFPGHSAFMPVGENRELYNGNISSMAVNIGKLNQPQLYNYQYDQLNRLVAMDAYRGYNTAGNNWNSITPTSDYKERVSYDANGNILGYSRNGTTAGGKPIGMDNLTYQYFKNTDGSYRNNRLKLVNDAVPTGNYTEDIDDQLPFVANAADSNYVYDAIGNLISDKAEKITNVDWNVYGKILSITKTATTVNGDVRTISYTYDASGNRVSKKVVKRGMPDKYTWYVRDATGNVMAVYDYEGNTFSSNTLYLAEHHLYGNSRLGLWNRNINMDIAPGNGTVVNLLGPTFTGNFVRGNKFFELGNHLQNVLVTISDKKIGHTTDGTTIDYYTADVVTANDFYPFGFKMPGRKFTQPNSKYRYGFNGKESDDELKGDGNALDFGDRSIYDPRLGRFVSVDPNYRQLPDFSPYQYARNNPIMLIENGKDGIIPKWLWRTGLIDPMAAGFIDAIADDVKGLVNVAEVITAFNPTQFYFYTPSASQVRHDTWQMTKTVLNVMSNPVLQAIVAVQAYEKISNTIKNADVRDYQYATGYAGWQVLTALVGVGEAKAIMQGGKASVEVLKLISGFGKVEKGLEILEGGFKVERKLAGFADKVAVIGRDFETNVKGVKNALESKLNKKVTLFEPTEKATKAWEKLKIDYKGNVPDEIARGSQIYKENLKWAEGIKKEGYTIYDAGLGTQTGKGTFYGMETKTIFGDK